jgi:hypothetical protein
MCKAMSGLSVWGDEQTLTKGIGGISAAPSYVPTTSMCLAKQRDYAFDA